MAESRTKASAAHTPRARRGPGLRACLVTIVALAAAPAIANAAPNALVDDEAAHFAAGKPSETAWLIDTSADTASVALRRTGLSESFGGTELPATLTPAGWTGGPGTWAVDSGALRIDGARVTGSFESAPSVVEARATFASEAFQNVGLGFTLNDDSEPFAIFSTGGGALPLGLYARTRNSSTTGVTDTLLTGIDPLVPHTYRIEWSATGVQFFVDGASVVTHEIAIGVPMRPVVSDFEVAPGDVRVDWLGMGPHFETGTFESRVHRAVDPRAVWGTLTTEGSGNIRIETRSGDDATPDGAWVATNPDGSVNSPPGEYLQYRATLTRGADGSTPTLDRVEIGYEIDVVAPTTILDPVDDVNAADGGIATITFSSIDDDVAGYECRLDNAVTFAACQTGHETEPLETGTHTVYVRAFDFVGNRETPAEQRSFDVDVDAPVTTIGSVSVSGNTATVSFTGNETATFECRLDSATGFAACASGVAFSGLTPGSHTVSVRAVDQAGNTGAADEETFVIAAPAISGGNPAPGGGGSGGAVTDTTGPAVAMLTKSVRATPKGDVKVRVKCPAGEVRCVVTMVLKHGRKTAATKAATVVGGRETVVTLRLATATKRKLDAAGKLGLKAVVTAKDHLGNARKATYALTVRR